MSEFIIYNVPTVDNPNRTIIGVPDDVQLSAETTSISIEQSQPVQSTNPVVVETLGEASVASAQIIVEEGYEISNDNTSGALFASIVAGAEPLQIAADKNIFEIDLLPNSDVSIIPSLEGALYPPIAEVKRIQIPEGYIPVEDIDPLEEYAYGTAYGIAGEGFGLLNNITPPPEKLDYSLVPRENGRITVHGSQFVDSVRIDWSREDRNDGVFDWTTYGIFELTSDLKYTVDAPMWDMSGKFILRAVPYHRGYPLIGYKQYEYRYEKDSIELRWTYIQLDRGTYRLKLEGYHHHPSDYIEIYEEKELLAEAALSLNNDGYISQNFILNSVSDDVSPRLEIKWYKRHTVGKAYYYSSHVTVYKNYAEENISLSVTKTPDKRFIFQLTNPENSLYNPPQELNALSIENSGWQVACQTKKQMVYLEICRHQQGQKTSYGYYLLNITQGSNPKFLEESGFKIRRKIQKGFEFSWQDTAQFRQLANVDSPDETLPMEYEFRLLHWTAGVDQSVRANSEYRFTKDVSINASGGIFLHRYGYNTWTNEHPSVKYSGINPPRIKNNAGSHLMYGRSKKAIVTSATPLVEPPSEKFEVEKLGWEVLYEIDHDAQQVKEYPFFKMNIKLGATTVDNTHEIRVYLDESDTLIGRYHPSLAICVVDFLGYFELSKKIIEETDFSHVFKRIEDSNPEGRLVVDRTNDKSVVAEVLSERLNTKEKKLGAKNLETASNRVVAEKATTSSVFYRIEIHFNNNETQPYIVEAKTDTIPSIPKEPSGNTSFGLGNPVIDPKAYNIGAGFSEDLANAISDAQIVSSGRLETKAVISDQISDGFGVFR